MANEFPDGKPLFLHIAEMLENGIANGAYAEGAPVPSTTELAIAYTINPATALKGVNILVDKGLIYKRRGVGMFVAEGARNKILQERKLAFGEDYVEPVIRAAHELGISQDDVIEMIKGAWKNAH